MGYEKRSSNTSHYRNVGGVNLKSSKYLTDNPQVLDLRNLDFFVPGAWAKTPGSTQSVATGSTGAIRSMAEFEKLDGSSYIVASNNVAVIQKVGATGFTDIISGFNNNQPFDFVPFVNKLWMANGQTFLNWSGQTLTKQGLPCFANNGVNTIGATGSAGGATFLGFTGTNASLLYAAAFIAYVDGDGRFGPVNANYGTTWSSGLNSNGGPWYSWTNTTQTPFAFRINNITCPSGYNITAIAVFLYLAQGTSVLGINLVGGIGIAPTLPSNFRLWAYFSTGVTTAYVDYQGGGAPLGWSTYGSTAGEVAYTNLSHPLNYDGELFCFGDTFTPRYLEINQNSMWLSGFSAAPSQLWFTEPGAPDQITQDATFEVRTNDSDRITGIKSYQNQLIIFKQRSFHKVIGDDADNYQLIQLSQEYGCLSNKAIVEYNNELLFLDEKGIVRFNGANWSIISTPVEDIFRRMSVSSALENACAIHYQDRNQVWFGIPIDGATYNNFTVVYDYLIDAWTFIEGFSPASFATMKGALSKRTNWYGDYSGMISYMGPSFYSYNGTAFTCKIGTKFDSPDGEDVTNIFRRMFLDVNTVSGVTGRIDVQVLSDYDQSTVKATFAVYQDAFQTRADFGVVAKSIGFNMQHSNPSLPLVINGYDVQRRFMRRV